jgi:hypothetical protein
VRIRQALRANRSITLGISICMIALASLWIVSYGIGSRASLDLDTGRAFFTDDDGTTWFKDDARKVPPFDRNGKQAVRCFIYKCGENGTPWVSHLMRYTPEGTARLKTNTLDPGVTETGPALVEVKEPNSGERGWVSENDPRAIRIQELVCPDGARKNIIAVDPDQ